MIDLNMPIMDGIETIIQLRAWEKEGSIDLSHAKVIANSAVGLQMFKNMKHSNLFDGFSNIL